MRYCVIIPTYNHSEKLSEVIASTLKITEDIIVVNDGSTDATSSVINGFRNIIRVEYQKNRGKGYALRQGFRKAKEMGFDYAITIDSDGQHNPEEILSFLASSEQHPKAIIVGARNLNANNMPEGNTFANKFSNFWFKAQTSISLPDTQSGFRMYPVDIVNKIHTLSGRYAYELELLVRSAWRGIEIISIPISVFYDKEGERKSHFRPYVDFTRISLLNTFLTIAAVVYGYPRKLLRKIFG